MKLSNFATFALLAALLLSSTTTGCGGRAGTDVREGEIVLNWYETNDPRSIDPHKSGDTVSSEQCGMCYECLYQYDYLARPAKLIPCLAVGDPEYDEATRTYTFTVRDDIYFQDDRCFHPDARGKYFEDESELARSDKAPGRKLTARDLEYSFKRLAALPDSGGYWVIEHKIAGLDEWRERAMKLKTEEWKGDAGWFEFFDTPVSGLHVLDDTRLAVTLSEPYPQFLYAITLSYGAAVPREAGEYYGDQLTRHPVGTGPYILDHWWEQKELVWVRNPKFRAEYFPTTDNPEDELWKPLMGKRLPLCDRVVFRIIKETQPQFLEFLDGRLAVSGMDKDQFTQAMSAQSGLTDEFKQKGIRLRDFAEPTIHYIGFNMTDPVVGAQAGEKGRGIRRALAHALNREDYIRRLRNNRGEPAGQLTPPGMVGHNADYFTPSQRFDLDKARQALRDAGYRVSGAGDDWETTDPDTGRQVTITILHRSTTNDTKDYAVFLNNMGRRVGIVIENELMTFPEFLKRQDEGTGQCYDAGWVMDYPDAQNMMQLLYGPNKPPGINATGYSDAEYDRLYREMAVLEQEYPDQAKLKVDKIRRMNEILDRDVPWVYVNYQKTYSLYHDWFYPSKWREPNVFAYTYFKFFAVDPERANVESKRESPFLPGFLLLTLAISPAILMGWRIARNRR